MSAGTRTPLPWRWQGEDYRGGWGWQLLVGPDGQGIICGERADGKPYENLLAYTPIDPQFCKTGILAEASSAPAIHIRQEDAEFLLTACNGHFDLVNALRQARKHLLADTDAADLAIVDAALTKVGATQQIGVTTVQAGRDPTRFIWYVEHTDTHERETFPEYMAAIKAYDAIAKDAVLCRGNGTVLDCK